MGENPSHFSRTGGGKDAVKDIPDADLKRFPVESVSWEDCQQFIARLNEKTKEAGWTYTLPSAGQWEYACRGGPMTDRAESQFDFYFAQPTNQLLPEQANSQATGLERSCKVGAYAPNRLGLHDMHGNVWEWCKDEVEPHPEDLKRELRRVDRGGGWDYGSEECRAVIRSANSQSLRGGALGLRLARVRSGAASPEAKTPPPDTKPR